jgi:hypothetical protein
MPLINLFWLEPPSAPQVNTTAPHVEEPVVQSVPVASNATTGCHSLGSCSACAEQNGCVWCEESSQCFDGMLIIFDS